MDSRTYQIDRSTITLIFGDLTTSRAEVLVSSDDYMLSMGGGVSMAISRAAGQLIVHETRKMVPARAGDVIVTTAGRLPAKYVFHAVTIGSGNALLPDEGIVRQATRRAMEILPLLGCQSIAFPAIGTGVAGIPHAIVASQMAATLVDFLLDAPQSYRVELYLLDRWRRLSAEDFYVFFEAFTARTMGVTARPKGEGQALTPPRESEDALASAGDGAAARLHWVYTMLRHLDTRRNQLESVLVQHIASDQPLTETALAQVRAQLSEIQQLRQMYAAELNPTASSPAAQVPDSVFLSSTALDLQPHRQALRSLIEGLRLKFIGMEDFAPSAMPPAELIRQKVSQSQVYLGVIGMRYGYVEPAAGLSMTELEYRQAIASRKTMCMFVMDNNAPITPAMVEDDPERFSKLLDFRKRVLKSHTCSLFRDVADLAARAEKALNETFVNRAH